MHLLSPCRIRRLLVAAAGVNATGRAGSEELAGRGGLREEGGISGFCVSVFGVFGKNLDLASGA